MELLVTLRKKELFDKLLSVADGFILGSFFTTSYHLDRDDMVEIRKRCKDTGKSYYVVMDNFITEDERNQAFEYMDFIHSLDVDGIYFHDLGIINIARSYDMVNKLIYDGKTVLCNSLDTAFMLRHGIDSVLLSREITLAEINDIIRNNPGHIDLQIFGHLRLSYSYRKFLKNYFSEINKDYDYLGKESLSLIEEQRNYHLPIVEDENGTYIYSDYVLLMFDEIIDLSSKIKRGIVDSLFIDDSCLQQVCRDYHRITKENKDFLKQSFLYNYPDEYSSGYLYQKTNKTKDEQD